MLSVLHSLSHYIIGTYKIASKTDVVRTKEVANKNRCGYNQGNKDLVFKKKSAFE